MKAILFDKPYQAESASEDDRARHLEFFRTSIVAFRLKTRKLDVEPHSGGFSLKATFSGAENYEFRDAANVVVPDEIMLVRENETYQSAIASSVETDSFSLFFPQEFYDQLSSSLVNQKLQQFLNSGASNASFPVDRALTEVLRRLAGALDESADELAVEELVAQLLRAIGLHIEDLSDGYSNIRMSNLARKTDRLRRVMRARELLHNPICKDIDLARLASEAHMSEFHFLRSFAEAFGITPSRYLERLKIDRAKHLLSNTQTPVKMVASSVGYDSFSAFCRSFRRVTGVTPKVFRTDQHQLSE